MIDNAFFVALFLLHLWSMCPEVSCYYFYYLRKYNDNPYKNNNTTNQTSNDTIQCQYSHTSCNTKIFRHKKHTHFSDTIGTSYQNPIEKIIKPICFIANRITCNHPQNKNTYRNNYFKQCLFHAIHLRTYRAALSADNNDSSLRVHYKEQ